MSTVKQLYPKQRPGINWVYIGLLALLVIAILSSCSTTIKNKSSFQQKTEAKNEEKKGIDTSASKKTDLQQQQKAESTAGSSEENEVKKEFNIDFDFGNGSAEDYTKTDTVIGGTKIKTTGPGTVKFNADGSIEATGKIKNASYKETGKTKKQDTSTSIITSTSHLQVVDQKNGIDTTYKKATEVTTITAKNKEVHRTSYWGYLWFLLIPAVWVGGWWLGLWPLIPKRRKRDEYPVKYTNYEPPKPPVI